MFSMRTHGSATLVLALTVISAVRPTMAATVTFSDGTFNLSDYSTSTSTQTGTVAISQVSSGGNPGSALLVSFSTPATPAFTTDTSSNILLNNTFIYNPQSSGPVGEISFSIDKSITYTPSTVGIANGQGFLISQAGNLYIAGVGLTSTQGVYQTASFDGLSANSFALFRSASGTAPAHPDFSGGPMELGFTSSLSVPANFPNVQFNALYDNFDVTVTPTVPLPAAGWLMLSGLGGLAAMARRRRAA